MPHAMHADKHQSKPKVLGINKHCCCAGCQTRTGQSSMSGLETTRRKVNERRMQQVPFCSIKNCCWSQLCCAVQIPLVGMSDELEADMMQCLEQRAALSPTALPSAAFYTFVNSHHTLNCVTTSSDAACVAGQPSMHHASWVLHCFTGV